MTDFGTPPPPPPPTFPVPPPPVPPARTGPPWEGEGPAVQRWIDTAKGVLTDPVVTFSRMRYEGGLGAPLVYFLIGMAVGLVGILIWQFAGLGMGMGFGGFRDSGAMGLAGMGIAAYLVFIPVCATIGIFIGAFLVHFALGLFGGQKYPFEATFRVLTYAHGSTYPILLVPGCGGAIAGLWGLIVAILGLAQMQETATGKAAAAVLTPVVLCCGLFFFFWAAIFAMLVGGAALSH
jgi:hypothetical protein